MGSAVQRKSKSEVKKSAVERREVSADVISAESKPQQLYQSPRDRDGDYSYAYDCSISPAVVIKWGEDEESEDEPVKVKNENIYEEIQEVRQDCSSGSNTDSGIGVSKSFTSSAGSSSIPSKGTLDVKKKVQQQQQQQRTVKPMSSLDALLSHTTLTPDQRIDLRKSLVDELFEELIQRHHKRVLDELKLDVEEFIAPDDDQELSTPKSSRSSHQFGLTRCESMDFKSKDNNNQQQSATVDPKSTVRLSSKLWQSARKCSEVIQRKWRKKSSEQQQTTTETSSSATSSNDVITPSSTDWPQVSRRGRRPLSAVVTANKSSIRTNVINEDEPDSDSEQEARRLLRSQIIKSFWEQHDLENNQDQVPGTAEEDNIR